MRKQMFGGENANLMLSQDESQDEMTKKALSLYDIVFFHRINV